MRLVTLTMMLAIAVPTSAQVTIDSNGIRTGDTRIDASGVHTGSTNVTGRGIPAGARGNTTINGNRGTRTIDCHGGALTISGNRNQITARECREITLVGNRNQLRWHSSAGRAEVSNVGNGNSVIRF